MSHPVKTIEGITKGIDPGDDRQPPGGVARKGEEKRAPHMAPNDPNSGSACVKSNRKTVPAWSAPAAPPIRAPKGVVWDPSATWCTCPAGRSLHSISWGTQRNLMSGKNGVSQFAMQFTCDFQEKDIVYGGDKKLARSCERRKELFPLAKGISILSMPGRAHRRRHHRRRQEDEPTEAATSPSSPATARACAASPSRSATTSRTTPFMTTS